MGKASELAKHLREHPLEPHEEAARRGARPELKLKPDSVVEAPVEGEIGDALAAIGRRELRNVLLRDTATGMEGVLVPVDRYVELVGTELESTSQLHVRPDGQYEPAGLRTSEIEIVDPTAGWPTQPH